MECLRETAENNQNSSLRLVLLELRVQARRVFAVVDRRHCVDRRRAQKNQDDHHHEDDVPIHDLILRQHRLYLSDTSRRHPLSSENA